MLLALALFTVVVPKLAGQALPKWVIAPEAKDSLKRLWMESVAGNREHVGCLGGMLGLDTVRVDRVILLDEAPGDSLNAPAALSLATCGPPRWIGTVHTHVRSTDDRHPAPRFSPDDRVVMSVWSRQWSSKGAFCVVYSDHGAHCEVYPPPRSRAYLTPAPND